jgi:hypothetical protein
MMKKGIALATAGIVMVAFMYSAENEYNGIDSQFIYGQTPSSEQLDAVGNKAFHIADMSQTIISVAERCQNDILNQDFSTFDACSNFIGVYEQKLLQVLNESSADITSIRGY